MKAAELLASLDKDDRCSLGSVWDHVERPKPASLQEKIKSEVIAAFERLKRAPLLTLLGILSMVVLVSALFVSLSAVTSVSNYAAAIPSNIRLFVSFKTSDPGSLQAWAERFRKESAIASIEMISPSDGLKRMQEALKLSPEMTSVLEESKAISPLAFITLKSDQNKIREKLQSLLLISPEVDSVAYDETTYAFAKTFAGNLTRVCFFGIVGLCLVAISLIGTLVLLSFYAHRQELEVMKLLGATHGVVLIPVVLDGVLMALFGICGGLLLTPMIISYLGESFASMIPPGTAVSSWWIVSLASLGVLAIGAAASFGAGMLFLSSHRGSE